MELSNKKNPEEPSKQALQARWKWQDAAREFDSEMHRSVRRELDCPRFSGQNLGSEVTVFGSEAIILNYELARCGIGLVDEGDFAKAENELTRSAAAMVTAVSIFKKATIDSDIGGLKQTQSSDEDSHRPPPHPNICQILGLTVGSIDTFWPRDRNVFFITDCLSETL
jgi:hypothetical protein